MSTYKVLFDDGHECPVPRLAVVVVHAAAQRLPPVPGLGQVDAVQVGYCVDVARFDPTNHGLQAQ